MDKLDALIDGLYCGLDPIGRVIGHISKNDAWVGYVADKYGFIEHSVSIATLQKVEPMRRDNIEKTLRELGGVVGLGCNIVTLGIPQLFFSICGVYNILRE